MPRNPKLLDYKEQDTYYQFREKNKNKSITNMENVMK